MAKIHRFIDDFNLSDTNLEIGGEIAHQIIKVLKLEVGEQIELSDGKGSVALATIKETSRNNLKVEIINIEKEIEENKKTLFCAILKKENFELVVQKTTECGISKIVPVISTRTVKTGLNMERLKKIAKEAAEQSGRTIVPEILEPITFDEALELGKNDFNLFFHLGGEKLPPPTPSLIKEGVINIWIGPEGGWTNEETEKAKNLNFKITSLGKLTLRGETAAIVASYLISNLQ